MTLCGLNSLTWSTIRRFFIDVRPRPAGVGSETGDESSPDFAFCNRNSRLLVRESSSEGVISRAVGLHVTAEC
jgi:hypothetical protein